MATLKWIRAHPVAAYVVWMLTIGWAFALAPTVATRALGVDLPQPPFILASTWLGMLLPALVITRIADGPHAVRGLLQRALPPRASIGWYAVALIAVPSATVALAVAAFGAPQTALDPLELVSWFLVPVGVGLITNNLWEEIAVMGFVQARLQTQRGPLLAAALTAVVFTLQHLPILGSSAVGLVLVTAIFIPYRAFVGWIYNRTGNLFLVGLTHAAGNAVAVGSGFGPGLLQRLYEQPDVDQLHVLAQAGLGLLAIVATRGGLGIRRSTTHLERTSMFHPLLASIKRHSLVSFFILAFAFSWAIMIPQVLGSYGLIPFPELVPLLIVMGYGPTFAALVVTAAVGGRPAIRPLLRRLLIWRVGWRWWAVTLFLNLVLVSGALAIYALLGNPLPPLPALGPMLLLDIVLTFLVSGLINGEEIGWRGFATPRLLERYGTIGTVAVLGVPETLFHLPIFFNNGQSAAGGQNGMPFFAFTASVAVLVFFFTWLYQHTRGSLLIAIAFHASANTWTTVLAIPSSSPTFTWLMAGAGLVLMVLVLLMDGTHWMARRRLTASAASPVAVRA